MMFDYHIEPTRADGHYFGWLNGRRILRREYADAYSDRLIELLSSRKSRFRWIAADQLGKLRERRAVEQLRIALNDPHWLVRLHAAKALGRIGNSRAITSLVNTLGDKSQSVRRRAAAALGCFGNDAEAVEALISAANDSDKIVRAHAVMSLSKIAAPHVTNVLANAARDEDANVSWRAVAGLQRRGTAVVESMLALLSENNKGIVYRAIKTLGNIGDSRATKALAKFLNSPDERLRQRARYALNQIARGQRRSGSS